VLSEAFEAEILRQTGAAELAAALRRRTVETDCLAHNPDDAPHFDEEQQLVILSYLPGMHRADADWIEALQGFADAFHSAERLFEDLTECADPSLNCDLELEPDAQPGE